MGYDTALLLLFRAESDGDRVLCVQTGMMRTHICKLSAKTIFFSHGSVCSARSRRER